MSPIAENAAAYAAFFETLTVESLSGLDALCAPDVRFRDPFHDVAGLAQFRAILRRMLEDVRDARFEILDCACAGRVCYLRWTFSFAGRRGRQQIPGVSEVHFDSNAKVKAHVDHWDGAAIYELVPVLGTAIRAVRKRIASRGQT